LADILDRVYLPRKGKLSEAIKLIEHSEEFITARHRHSAVESSINGLEHTGLDRCCDHGPYGFKRYVVLAVLAKNLHTLRSMVQQREVRRAERQGLKKAA